MFQAGQGHYHLQLTLWLGHACDRSSVPESSDGRTGRKEHAAVKAGLDAWFHEVRRACWRNPADLKRSYGTASMLASGRVVFNIKGNEFRLVAAVDYGRQILYIKWLGRHRDYDGIDARTVEHES